MKKMLITALLCCAVLLGGCDGNDAATEPEPEESGTVLSAGDCFKVTEDHSSGVIKFSYSVSSKDGELLESALCSEQPKVAIISPDLIAIRFTNDDSVFCRYYDVEKGLVSKSFFNAFWDNGELVAYNSYSNGHKLIVENIFSDDGYYYETVIDSMAWNLKVTACEYDEETGELHVSYVYGGEDTEGTAVLPTVEKPAEPTEP